MFFCFCFFFLFNLLFIHYSLCKVCVNNLKVWGTLMQLRHNKKNFLGYIRNLKDLQIFFQNLLSKNYWWKNTLSLSKVLICYEIETFTTWSPLEVWRWHNFSIFVDNIKNRFVDVSTISHHLQTAWKVSSVKGQHRWKNLITIISSWKHVHFSKNSFF